MGPGTATALALNDVFWNTPLMLCDEKVNVPGVYDIPKAPCRRHGLRGPSETSG